MRKIKIPSNVIDAIDYDVNDLLLVSDILITDYSSVFFDYLILNRPIIFYPYDFHEHSKPRNGFYIDYEKEVPGPIAYTEDDVIKYLLDKKILSSYDNKREVLRNKINKENDGNVCKKIISKIIKNEF